MKTGMEISTGTTRTINTLFEWSLYLIILTLPISTAACSISVGVAFILSFLIFLASKAIHKSISLLPAIIFVLYVPSFLLSTNVERARSSLELGVSYLLIPFLFGFAGDRITPKLVDRLLKMFAAMVLLICVVSYVRIVVTTGHVFLSGGPDKFSYYRPFSRFAFSEFLNNIHPSYLSFYLLFVMVIIFQKIHSNVVLKAALVGLVILFLLILASKNQVVVCFPLISILIWINVKLKPAWKTLILVGVIAGMAVVGGGNDQIRYRFKNEINTTVGDRVTLWAAGIDLISENWLLGVGIGDSRDRINERMATGHPELVNFNLHNQYLEFTLSLGVAGLAAFLLLLAIPLYKKADLPFCLFILIIATSSLTESILQRQKGLVFFLVFYGLLGLPYNLPINHKRA